MVKETRVHCNAIAAALRARISATAAARPRTVPDKR
jgi:hypothetical protein